MSTFLCRCIAALIGTTSYFLLVELTCLLRVLDLSSRDKLSVAFFLWVTDSLSDYYAVKRTEDRIYQEQTGLR